MDDTQSAKSSSASLRDRPRLQGFRDDDAYDEVDDVDNWEETKGYRMDGTKKASFRLRGAADD